MDSSIFYIWRFFKNQNKANTIILNFGPQHPAAHGVLRLIIQLENEIIQRVDPHIGLLHRGTESLITAKNTEQSIPYFDRLDYVSMMTQEHAFCLVLESLINKKNNNIYINYIRILFDELTRLLNHFLAITCHALDIGSMSTVFWGFEEREILMEFYERVCGARMHAAFHRPSIFFSYHLSASFIEDILKFIQGCYVTLNEIHTILTYNKIWKQRLINIATLTLLDCQNYNLTGVMSRSVGLKRDLRLVPELTYSSYSSIFFKSFIGLNGDTYDRYLIRMLEMGESLNIINKVLTLFLTKNFFKNFFNLAKVEQIQRIKTVNKQSSGNMEHLITHFLRWHTGLILTNSTHTIAIESPKGEFGVILSGNETNKPIKCKIRSPSYFNLQALSLLCKGHYLADLSTIIGTIDIVFGEIDR